MMPRDMAATPARSATKLSRALWRPPPTGSSLSPRRRSAADAHVTHEDLAGRRTVLAHLAHRRGLDEPVHPAVEHEGQDLAVAHLLAAAVVEFGVHHDGVGVGTVGDPGLLAVEDVVLAVALGAGAHAAERVGTGVRLGDRPGADLVQRHEVERPAFHLRRRAELVDRPGGQSARHAERREQPRAHAAQFDRGDELRGRVRAAGSRATAPRRRSCA